jgi:hypothetical protein
MKSSNVHMSTEERLENLVLKVENLVCILAKDRLKALENEEAKLKRLLRPCAFDLDDWLPIKSCEERLKEIQNQQKQLRKSIFLHQKIIQKPPIASNRDISLEMIVETKGDKIASEQEELDLCASVVPSLDEYPESCIKEGNEEATQASCEGMINDLEKVVKVPCEENVESLEEVVETSLVEVIKDLEGDVEVTCGESLKDLEKVIETICIEKDDVTIECGKVFKIMGLFTSCGS